MKLSTILAVLTPILIAIGIAGACHLNGPIYVGGIFCGYVSAVLAILLVGNGK